MACTPRPMLSAFFVLFLCLCPGRLLALDQPLAAYWHPKDLRGWTPDRDPSFVFNQDLTVLQARVPIPGAARLLPLFPQQTSGHPTTLHQKAFSHIQEYWSNADTLVYFGGSASEGLILSPPPGWIRAAHRNGARILGSVFFPPNAYGGQAAWVDDFLHDQTLEGLIAVAKAYGFDGYFINQETAAASVKEVGPRMIEALRRLRDAGLEISWYDSMLMSGSVSWQRNLNSNNKPFFDVSGSIFLDFGGSSFKTSATLAGQRSRSVFQGLNVYNGYSATQMKAMVDAGLSVGTYATESIATDAQQKSFYLDTINALMPPAALDLGSSFTTHFNTGKGDLYFTEGLAHTLHQGSGAWRDLRQQSYLPNQTPALGVTQTFDSTRAYEGGTSLLVSSDRAGATPLFRHLIQVDGSFLKITYWSEQPLRVELQGTGRAALELPAGKTWQTRQFAIDFTGTINSIQLVFPAAGKVHLGYLEISRNTVTTSSDSLVDWDQNKITVRDNPYRLYSEVWAQDADGRDVLVEWVGSGTGYISNQALSSKGLRLRHVCRQNVECPDTRLF